MTVAVLGIDWQTLADAIGLGAIYALMAVGIGLVFGVLRLVNFAYGQLVMAGAYALAFGSLPWGKPCFPHEPPSLGVASALAPLRSPRGPRRKSGETSRFPLTPLPPLMGHKSAHERE